MAGGAVAEGALGSDSVGAVVGVGVGWEVGSGVGSPWLMHAVANQSVTSTRTNTRVKRSFAVWAK